MERIIEVEQFFPFAGHHLGDRNASPAADDGGDIFFAYFFLQELRIFMFCQELFLVVQLFLQFRQFAVFQFRRLGQVVVPFGFGHFVLYGIHFLLDGLCAQDGLLFFIPFFLELCFLGLQFFFLFRNLCQAFLGGVVCFLVQGLFFDFQLHNLMADFVERCRHGFDFRTQLSCGFIDQVDGFIRQETVGNVAV